MNKFIINISKELVEQNNLNEILSLNEITEDYGLTLEPEEAKSILITKKEALKGNGRIEFGSGIEGKLIEKFKDSPYIGKHNYVETIKSLIEMFYYYKNETLEVISDDDLIEIMKEFFNGMCQGSLEILQNKVLCNIEWNIKHGTSDFKNIYDEEEEDAYGYEEEPDQY